MNLLKVSGLALLLLSLGACATVTRGTTTAFSVESTPSNAQVKTNNGFACDATPCTFKMPRKAEFDVTISKEGYKPWTGHVTHAISGQGGAGMAGNVVAGGIIGVGVDAASGAMYDLKPNPLKVTLDPVDATASKPSEQPAS